MSSLESVLVCRLLPDCKLKSSRGQLNLLNFLILARHKQVCRRVKVATAIADTEPRQTYICCNHTFYKFNVILLGYQFHFSSRHHTVIFTSTHTLSLSSRGPWPFSLAAPFCLLHTLSACCSHAPLSAADIISIQPECNIDEGSTIGLSKSSRPRSNIRAHCQVYMALLINLLLLSTPQRSGSHPQRQQQQQGFVTFCKQSKNIQTNK